MSENGTTADRALVNLLSEKWNRGMSFDAFLDYSNKNVEAMREGFANVEIAPTIADEARGLGKRVRVLVLAADWCGDVVANLPAIARLADLGPSIELRVLDRDRHADLMAEFLTNGGMAIPKVIVAPTHMGKFSTWGPRPPECQKIMTENKGKMPKEEIYPLLREWYMNDKYQSAIREIFELIKTEAEID